MKKIEWLKGEKKWISNNSEKFSVLLKFSQNSLCMWVSESDIVMEEGRKKSAVRVSEWVSAKGEVRERERVKDVSSTNRNIAQYYCLSNTKYLERVL
jgi:hypothetical protein